MSESRTERGRRSSVKPEEGPSLSEILEIEVPDDNARSHSRWRPPPAQLRQDPGAAPNGRRA